MRRQRTTSQTSLVLGVLLTLYAVLLTACGPGKPGNPWLATVTDIESCAFLQPTDVYGSSAPLPCASIGDQAGLTEVKLGECDFSPARWHAASSSDVEKVALHSNDQIQVDTWVSCLDTQLYFRSKTDLCLGRLPVWSQGLVYNTKYTAQSASWKNNGHRASLQRCDLASSLSLTVSATVSQSASATQTPTAASTDTQSATPAPTTSPPTHGPLGARCVTGAYDRSNSAFVPFTAGLSALPTGPHVTGGYELTLTNNSSITIDVNRYTVAFYSGYGAKLGSDSKDVTETPITHGQSHTWTESTSSLDVGTTGAVDSSSTCSLVAWR